MRHSAASRTGGRLRGLLGCPLTCNGGPARVGPPSERSIRKFAAPDPKVADSGRKTWRPERERIHIRVEQSYDSPRHAPRDSNEQVPFTDVGHLHKFGELLCCKRSAKEAVQP